MVNKKNESKSGIGRIVYRTYLVLSQTNYGETVTVINAKDESELKEIASQCDTVWDGYDFEEIDTHAHGKIGCYGGS